MTRLIESAAGRRPLPPWASDLLHRIWTMLLLKTLGICAFMWLFFLGYFAVLRNPASPAVTMPLTPVDIWLPFQPGWLPVYLSLWFYVGIAPGIMLGLRELLIYGAWAAGMCLVGLSLFYFFPTAVPPLTVDVTGLPGFAMLQGVDAPGNACPSLHVAASMFTALWIERLFKVIGAPMLLRGTNWVWLFAISYSTMAVRQHVFLDVLAGAALGLAFAWASMRWSTPVRVRGETK